MVSAVVTKKRKGGENLLSLLKDRRAFLEDKVKLGVSLCNGHGDMSYTAGDIDYFRARSERREIKSCSNRCQISAMLHRGVPCLTFQDNRVRRLQ